MVCMKNRVCAVVVTYNRIEKLKKCIENGIKILYISFVKNLNKDNIIKTKEELLQKILENEY